MARKRIEGTVLDTWADADAALRELGAADIALAQVEGEMNERIMEAKADAANRSASLLAKKKGLEVALKEWAEANRADFDGKSKRLNFGTLSFRLSTRVVIKKVENTLKLLKSFGLMDYVKVREEPFKEKMHELDDKMLAKVGAIRKVEDVFGYEVDIEKLQEVHA